MSLPCQPIGDLNRDHLYPPLRLYPAADSDDVVPENSGQSAQWDGIVPSLAGKTAVIVEDEGITQLQIRKILTRAGVKVIGYKSTGEAGIEIVLATRPDLVLMDIKMPGAVDGLEAARQILASFKTCVIMLTAYDDFRKEAEEAGVSGYVVKPVTLESLLPRVKAASDKFYAV